MAERELPVPLVDGMIHRPAVPRHMMRLKPAARAVRVELDGRVLAEGEPLQLVEIGRDVYDPVWYFPRHAVTAELTATERNTHCPLKGDTTYYDLSDGSAEGIAWSYTDPLPFAEELRDLVAFDPSRVTVTLEPTGTG